MFPPKFLQFAALDFSTLLVYDCLEIAPSSYTKNILLQLFKVLQILDLRRSGTREKIIIFSLTPCGLIFKRYVLNIFLLVYITNLCLVFGLILKLKARRKHHLSRYRCKYTNFNLKNIKLVSLMYILDILVTRVCTK